MCQVSLKYAVVASRNMRRANIRAEYRVLSKRALGQNLNWNKPGRM
jgi:hypothetical protein